MKSCPKHPDAPLTLPGYSYQCDACTEEELRMSRATPLWIENAAMEIGRIGRRVLYTEASAIIERHWRTRGA